MPCRKDYVKESKNAQEVLDCLQEKFGKDLTVDIFREQKAGIENKVQFHELWLKINRERFLELIDELFEFDFLHFHITSGNDDGDVVTLYYHFSLFRVADRGNRLGVTVGVPVPKSDLLMPSLFDRIPGVEYSEREIREMFGVDFDGLPNKAQIFLPDDWDQTIKPWRRDETGPGPDVVNELS